MATLIPSINTCKDVTPGERRFARLLEAKLEDYYCWFNVPIGPARLHPDFIILHLQMGSADPERQGLTTTRDDSE